METTSAAETEALGIRLACALSGSNVITLAGELGAGKTVFVRGLACGLNMPPGVVVTSPTYVLQHVHRGGRLTLYHVDLYRVVGGADEFEASGLGECFEDQQGVVCIEWPERMGDFKWPGDRIVVRIDHASPNTRRLTFVGTGPRSQEAIKQIARPSAKVS
jgi:tRNA threonylcarbamoyladenosine biosynthesis protein TsaE